jgi:hypothetical protein
MQITVSRGVCIRQSPGVAALLALFAVIASAAVSTSSDASQRAEASEKEAALVGKSPETAGVRVDDRSEYADFDTGTGRSRNPSPLDPRLTGAWYWEAEVLPVPGAEIPIKPVSILTIYRDGGFILQEEGSEFCQISYRGWFVQEGDTLTGYCDNGQKFSTKFVLHGSDGLWLAGRLYGRQ